MEQEKKYLKVGDILYPKSVYGIQAPIMIERVTKTQAISGNKKFKIEYFRTAILIGASYGFGSANYYLETPELKQELWRSGAINTISTINFSKLSDDQLKGIIEILNK